MEKIYKNASWDATKIIIGSKALFFICSMFMAGSVWGQINYTQNFSTTTHSWTGWSRSTTSICATTGSLRKNVYTTGTAGMATSPSLGSSNGGQISMSYQYKIINYSGSTATPNTFGSFKVQYSTDNSSWSDVANSTISTNHTPSTSCSTVNLTFSPPSSTLFYIRFNVTYGTGDYYLYFDEISLTQGAAPSCLSPTITSTTSISATTATINWTAPSSAPSNGYEWEVRTSGAGGSGATGLVSSGTNAAGVVTKNVTGLTSNTSYTVYVRSNCGGSGFSSWSSGGAFTTPCLSISSYPYSEGFNSATLNNCFVASALSGATQQWQPVTADATNGVGSASEGTHFMRMNYYNASTSYNPYLLTFPTFVLDATAKRAKFDLWMGSSSGTNSLDFQISTNSGSTWTTLSTYTANVSNTSSSTPWTIGNTIDLSSYVNQTVVFRLKATSNYGSNYCNIGFDNFVVENIPSCFEPSLASTTNIGSNNATINWTAPTTVPSNGYEYYVSTSNSAPSSSTVATGSVGAGILTATLSGLNIETQYYFWIRSVCNSSDKSAWTSAGTFTTLPITSIQTGDWNDPSSWSSSTVPTCSNSVMILSGHNITVNSAGNQVKNTTIASGGTLTVASGGLTVGCTNNNTPLTNNGTLTVSGGTLTINGNMTHNNSSTFNQSGGDIIIDGNANGVTANSVPTGTNLLRINTNLLGLTGGKITIVDPHAGSSSTDYTIGYNTSGLHYSCGTNHTIQFGDGSSTEPGGHTNGFYNYLYVGTGYMSLGNVIVNSASGTNRHVNNTSTIGILGDLTITLGEFRTGSSTVYLAGNLSNSGTMTTDGTLAFAIWSGGSASSVSSAQTVSGSGTFRNATSSPTANFNSINIFNSSNTGVTIDALNNLSGASGFSGASVLSNITFNGKATTASGNALLWGTSTARGTGSLTVTSGGMTNGSTFAIGTTAAQTGTSITSGADPTSTSGRYPFVNSLSQNRSIYLQRVSPSGTGITAFTFNEVSGTTSVGITDGSYTMDTRSNDNFVFNSFGSSPNATTYNLAITAPAIFGSSPSSAVSKIVQSSGVIGTDQIGTVTPTAQRTGLTLSDLGTGEFYMGIHSDDIPFVSVMTGVWEDPAVWNKGTVPSCSDNVTIGSTHTVTSSVASNVTKNLTINSGGILIVDNGDLTVGCTNNNNTLTNNGTLTVSGGTLNINGSLSHNSGATFNQSGGDINIDGNNAGATATSATSYHLNLANAVNWTGGTLTIVDPHASATATDVLYYNTSANSNISSSHTLKFGDGASTNAGGNTIGFRANTYVSSGRINYGNLIINGGSGTNRVVTGGTYTNVILGNLTINANSEYAPAQTVSVAGNIVNNGIFTQTSTTALQGYSGTTASASTNAQTIGGSGTFRNSATTSTANIASLTINNSNATGVTLNVPLSVSGTLTMTSGIINTTSTNILRLGTSSVSGSISGTPSNTNFINGPFARTFAASRTSSAFSVTSTLFPVGVSGATPALMSIDINPVTNATGPVVFTVRADNSMSGTAGAGVTNLASVTWSAIPDNTANLTSAQIRLNRADASVTTTSKILYATANTDPFEGVPGGSMGTTSSNVSGSTQILTADYKNFFSYGDLVVCNAPADMASNLVASNKTTTSFTSTFNPASSNPTGYLVVRYTGTFTATAPTDGTLYSSGTALGGTVIGNYYTTPFTFNQTGLTANSAYTYKIYSFNNSGCSGPTYNATSYDETITTCGTSYSAPTSFSASNVTTNSMDINFTASTSSGVQDHYLDVSTDNTFTNFVSGFQNLQINAVASSGTQLSSISGLNPSTTYYIRIKATDGAGCESSYTTTLIQATDCNPESLPTSIQNFSTFTGSAPSPICWTERTGTLAATSTLSGSTSSWLNKSSGFANISSTNMGASINLYGTKNDWIISQPINLGSTSGNFRLKYKYAVTSYNGTSVVSDLSSHKVNVVISLDGGLTWSNTNILKTYTGASTYSASGAIETIDLSAYTGVIKLAFVATTTSNTPDIDFHIDDFIVEQTPAPTITSVTSSNQCGGNTKIVIIGTELNNISSATIGSQTLLPFDSTSSTRLVKTITTPLNGTTSISNNIGTATNATNITFTNAPALSVDSPSFTICSGSSATVNVTSTLTDYTSYTWSPATGVSGTTSATFNPTTTTTYTLNALNSLSGCVNSLTRTVTVDQMPSAIALTQGRTTATCYSGFDSLMVSGGFVNKIINLSSGLKNLNIPDNSASGLKDTITITGQAGTIDSITVSFNVTHDWMADAEILLRAPNGKIISLVADQGPSNVGSFTNCIITSDNSAPQLSSTSTIITGRYKANATSAGSLKGSFGTNLTTNFSDLFTIINGAWVLECYDDGSGDEGILLDWTINIYTNNQSLVWSPNTGLFTNRATTTAYAGTSLTKVYSKPTVSQKYYLTATNGACQRRDSIVDSIKNASNLVVLASASATGAVEQCTDANGWTYYGTATNPDEWLFGIYKNGSNFTATVDITVDPANKFRKSASSNGANQEHASYIMSRYWNVNATGTVGAGVKVRFFLDPQDIDDLLDERDNDYDVLKNTTNPSTLAVTGGFEWFKTSGTAYNPTNWTGNKHNGAIVKLTEDAVSTLNGQTYVELSGITSFSGGSGGTSFGPSNNGLFNSGGVVGLPVTWKDVKATAKETGNHIQWSTSSEKNTKSFVVEYSYDAKEFFEASKDILAAGNSATERFYEFNHDEEYGELVYYRIKQIDLDGKVDYSKAVVVKRTSKLPEFHVSMYPVPLNVQDLTVRIQTVQKTDISISINDLLGRDVYSETISPAGYNTDHKMNLSHLPQGTYHVTINNGVNKSVQVLVVGN